MNYAGPVRYSERIFHMDSEFNDVYFDLRTGISVSVLKKGNRNINVNHEYQSFNPYGYSRKRFALDDETYTEFIELAAEVETNNDFSTKRQLRELLQEIDISL